MRRALVTGVSRGIGRSVARMLLAEGWEVVGVSRTGVCVTRSDPPSWRLRHWRWTWDVATEPEPDDVVAYLGESLDALVHCAGIRGPYGPLGDVDEDAWVQTIATNLLGTYRAVRAALPLLRRSDDGRILLLSGGGAFDPAPGYSAYAAAKAGTVALMESLAEELAATTVSVNCVAPGFVATSIHDGTPLAGRPDSGHALADAVACIRHLLSPASSGLSGRTISAAHDDWQSLTRATVPPLMAGRMGQRDRIKIQRLAELARCAAHNRVPAGML